MTTGSVYALAKRLVSVMILCAVFSSLMLLKYQPIIIVMDGLVQADH